MLWGVSEACDGSKESKITCQRTHAFDALSMVETPNWPRQFELIALLESNEIHV